MKTRTIFILTAICLLFTASYAVGKINDENITRWITNTFIEDEGVSGYWIDVQTKNGIVTLSGRTDNILAKERAVRIAETVKGVRSVVDNIQVDAPMRKDAEIRSDVMAALLGDPATDSWEIQASVKDGVVTLTGTVDSWQEKQLAAKVAKKVRSVKDLKNFIDVEYRTERSDLEIREEVERMLEWDMLIDDALVDVKVINDKVFISGTVGSAAEKSEVILDAWVAGAKSVEASDLDVASWARDRRFRKDKYVLKKDSEITDAAEDAMFYDPRVNSFDVHVSAEDGVVSLSGIVDNLKAKRAAEKDARNTVGVWDVRNYILVRPDMPSDETIEKNVKKALKRDPYVEKDEITVSVINNIVYLSGIVDSYFEKAQADDVASLVYGVVDVKNNLEINDDRIVPYYDPYLYDWYAYDWYNYPVPVPALSDWEIKKEIEDELWWSPYVDEDQVTVTVDDGVATLTGTVDTMNERKAARNNAFEGGAVAVDNDLKVKYGPAYYRAS